jgi:HK97 family phage prohead protease
MAMEKPNLEIRTAEMRIAQTANDDEMIVEGYAAVFDQPTVLWEYDGVQYKETISRGAFDGADLKDVPFKYNHSDNVMIMARTRNKTLTLIVDDKGLAIRASLANTTQGRDLYELIKRGDIDKMSFAFVVQTDEYDRSTHTRTIKKFKRLYDVAAVDLPAYDQTSISARSYFDAQNELEAKVQQEEQRKRLILRTYL